MVFFGGVDECLVFSFEIDEYFGFFIGLYEKVENLFISLEFDRFLDSWRRYFNF